MASVTLFASANAGDYTSTSDSTYSALTDAALPWQNPQNLASDNGVQAYSGGTEADRKSLRLDITNWGFGVPAGAIDLDITPLAERWRAGENRGASPSAADVLPGQRILNGNEHVDAWAPGALTNSSIAAGA